MKNTPKSKFCKAFNSLKKIREITRKLKIKTVGKLKNDECELIVGKQDIKEAYQLFFDKRGDPPPF